MASLIVLDADVVISLLRGAEAARRWMRSSAERAVLAISVVTVAEVLGGMRSAERRPTHDLIDELVVLPVDEAIGRRAGELARRYRRSHHNIGIVDHLVAATALEAGAELATLNVKHFPAFPRLRPPFSV